MIISIMSSVSSNAPRSSVELATLAVGYGCAAASTALRACSGPTPSLALIITQLSSTGPK